VVDSLRGSCAARTSRFRAWGVFQTNSASAAPAVSRRILAPQRWRRVRFMTILVVVLAVGAWTISAVVPTVGAPLAAFPDKLPATAATAASGSGFPTPIRHVIIVMFENEPLSAIQADNGYLWSLTHTYAYASSFYSPCHPSSPNYLAVFSDSTQGRCGTDAPPPSGGFKTSSMATVAPGGNLTWAQYAESMPAGCPLTDSPPFVVHHTPALYFSAVTSSKTTCEAHVHSFTTATSLAGMAGFPENYVFITPDNNHNKPISASDLFATALIAQWSTESWWSSTVVFFVYDESATSDTKCPAGLDGISTTNCGGHVYLSAVSPLTSGVGAYTTNADQYSLYQTAAWLLGLPLGSTGTPMKSMFAASQPTKYTVSGTVTYASNGTAVSGAIVTLAPGSSTLTGSTGQYSFSAKDGSYTLSVGLAGFRNQSVGLTIAGQNVVQNFSLDPFLYLWTGTVTNSSSGAPIPGATVVASGGPSTTTNASGAYALNLANGTYSLTASAPGFQSATATVSVTGSAGTQDLSLGPNVPLTLSGTVSASNTGSVLEGAYVELSTGASVNTNFDGSYSFTVPSGAYTLTVTAKGYHSQVANVNVIDASVVQNFSLGPYLYWLNGTVLSPQNLPVAGANVSVSASEWQMTNASGNYAFLLPNGTYVVTIHAPAFPTADVPVAIQGSPVTKNLTLAPSTPGRRNAGGGLLFSAADAVLVGLAITGAGVGIWFGVRRSGIRWRSPRELAHSARELAHSATDWLRTRWRRR
jgi:hypothetical protein